MLNVSVSSVGGALYVRAPYNLDFIAAAHRAGGKWGGTRWVFDTRDEAQVRAALLHIYGTDGTAPADVVSVRLRFTEADRVVLGPIVAFGRVVASASGRDSGARLGEGVVVESGGFRSGGSMKNWATAVDEGCAIVVMHDIPRARAEAAAAERPEAVEILPPPVADEAPGAVEATPAPAAATSNIAALRDERERLVARIAAIDKILAAAAN